MSESIAPLWSVPVRVDQVGEAGRHVDLTADEVVRAAVAKAGKVTGVDELTAHFVVTPHRRDGLHVVGRVKAIVGQICGVSLEPMTNSIDEEVDLTFAPPRDVPKPVNADEEVVEGPEPLMGGEIDLGAIAIEFMLLGIDPYPRKPDAVFEAPKESAEDSPFAALAALKKAEK